MASTTAKCLRDEVEDLLFQERAEAQAYRERAEARIKDLERQLSQKVRAYFLTIVISSALPVPQN